MTTTSAERRCCSDVAGDGCSTANDRVAESESVSNVRVVSTSSAVLRDAVGAAVVFAIVVTPSPAPFVVCFGVLVVVDCRTTQH